MNKDDAIRAAHKALFKVDCLLAQTYSPNRVELAALHEELHRARMEIETSFDLETPEFKWVE